MSISRGFEDGNILHLVLLGFWTCQSSFEKHHGISHNKAVPILLWAGKKAVTDLG
jgi:hypothetical protein